MELLEIPFEGDPHLVTRKVVDEVILISVKPRVAAEPCLYVLDEVAAFLWSRLGKGATGLELARALQAQYEVDQERAEADVRSFLEELRSIEAIRPKES